MKNNTRKIVVLDRLDSARIEQAIFILRDENGICESDAVTEAERIVNTYLSTSSDNFLKNEKKKIQPKFFFGMFVYTLSTVLLTAYILTTFAK